MSSPPAPVLYAGDGTLQTAAAYLAGLLHHWQLPFDYRSSSAPLVDADIAEPRRLYIFSDYSARRVDPRLQEMIVEHVAHGAGLLMIGGWASFRGRNGEWPGTAIADILPVRMGLVDDRINCDQPALLLPGVAHETTRSLPFDHPPTIGGFNRVTARDDQRVALWVHRYRVSLTDDSVSFAPTSRDPALVFGSHVRGRTAALTFDCAPHWVGGLIDWGSSRIMAHAPGSRPVEVGTGYAKLLENVVRFAGHLPRAAV